MAHEADNWALGERFWTEGADSARHIIGLIFHRREPRRTVCVDFSDNAPKGASIANKPMEREWKYLQERDLSAMGFFRNSPFHRTSQSESAGALSSLRFYGPRGPF